MASNPPAGGTGSLNTRWKVNVSGGWHCIALVSSTNPADKVTGDGSWADDQIPCQLINETLGTRWDTARVANGRSIQHELSFTAVEKQLAPSEVVFRTVPYTPAQPTDLKDGAVVVRDLP